jgi:hypothetical protein
VVYYLLKAFLQKHLPFPPTFHWEVVTPHLTAKEDGKQKKVICPRMQRIRYCELALNGIFSSTAIILGLFLWSE